MKSIKEIAREWCGNNSNKGCKEPCEGCWLLNHPLGCEQHSMEEAYIQGANYVLDAVKNYINNIDLGNSAEEKFYKLDVIADIGLFIEQLKK